MSTAVQIASQATYIPSMSSSPEQIACPPTYRFRPKKRELVEFYLVPLARGQDPFPGVIFEDDAAGSMLPWDLFKRHGVGSEDEAYFIVRTSEARKPGARQDRACYGGVGTWKMQSSVDKSLRVRGERITVHVSNLNLHMGKGKDSGSVGWVMHEYTIAAPPCPSLVKICHIAFSGHGRKRMRVPDGKEVCQSSSHARVGDTASELPCSGAIMLDHGSAMAYASGGEGSSHLFDSSDLQCFPPTALEQYLELEAQVPTTEQQDIVPQLMVQQFTMPVAQQLSAGGVEFWSSLGVDVESSISFDQEQSTGVENSWVVPNTDAMATEVQSSWVVPNTGAMATREQSCCGVPNTGAMAGDLDDFCRSLLQVQTNCTGPDFGNMTTSTLGGGFSLICK